VNRPELCRVLHHRLDEAHRLGLRVKALKITRDEAHVLNLDSPMMEPRFRNVPLQEQRGVFFSRGQILPVRVRA